MWVNVLLFCKPQWEHELKQVSSCSSTGNLDVPPTMRDLRSWIKLLWVYIILAGWRHIINLIYSFIWDFSRLKKDLRPDMWESELKIWDVLLCFFSWESRNKKKGNERRAWERSYLSIRSLFCLQWVMSFLHLRFSWLPKALPDGLRSTGSTTLFTFFHDKRNPTAQRKQDRLAE